MKMILLLIMSIYISSINQAQSNVDEAINNDNVMELQRFNILRHWVKGDQEISLCFITDSIKSLAIDKVKSDIQYFYLASDAIAVNKLDYRCFVKALEEISFSEASFESPGNRIMDIIVVNDTGKEVKFRVDMNKDSLKMDSLIMNCLPKNSETILSFIHEG